MSHRSSVITRRDFLDGVKLATGSVLMTGASPLHLLAGQAEEFNGPGGIGGYAGANGNTHEVLREGHKIRDDAYRRIPAKALVLAGSKRLRLKEPDLSLRTTIYFPHDV